MTLHGWMLLVQTIFAAGMAWSCFCRLVWTSKETRREIRLAIWFEGVAAGMVLGTPFLPLWIPEFDGSGWFQWQPGLTPTWAYVALLVAAALMQWVTAKFWRFGTPVDFQHRGFS